MTELKVQGYSVKIRNQFNAAGSPPRLIAGATFHECWDEARVNSLFAGKVWLTFHGGCEQGQKPCLGALFDRGEVSKIGIFKEGCKNGKPSQTSYKQLCTTLGAQPHADVEDP